MASSDDATGPAADDGAAAFGALRGRLFGIAYRMLGSVAEAEDVVQDAWLRWQSTDRSAVLDAAAFLVTTTTRLAINVTQSARARRESYVGPWLPEPVDTTADPALGAERGEALELAVLLLLEKLPPAERAAYVLSEAFDYPYAQIASVLSVSEVNARQLASRARKHLSDGRREPAPSSAQRRLFDAFLAAARAGDLDALESLFTADVVSVSDGGGVVRAAGKPVGGAHRVARFHAAVARWLWDDAILSPCDVNGHGAVLIARAGTPYAVLTVGATANAARVGSAASSHGIDHVFWVMNPAKIVRIADAVQASTRPGS
jgi:RNA polymerase sigma-70 factor (ECF subfamily)